MLVKKNISTKNNPFFVDGDNFDLTSCKAFLNRLISNPQGSHSDWYQSNLPLNASLSYTLENLKTKVCITKIEGKKDQWRALKGQGLLDVSLSERGVKRFLHFFKVLKKILQVPGFYLVESANNFLADAGLASSASSFCALTLATHKMALDCSVVPEQVQKLNLSHLSLLSRGGSGSSCRSFFKPWAFWEGEWAFPVNVPYSNLIHRVIETSKQKKPVPSSLAHKRVVHSPLFRGRVKRAKVRLLSLMSALRGQDWRACFEITWEEFQDLHQLYESVGILYQNDKSRAVLGQLRAFWQKHKDGPLVTMDAGSAVHLLYRQDQKHLIDQMSLL